MGRDPGEVCGGRSEIEAKCGAVIGRGGGALGEGREVTRRVCSDRLEFTGVSVSLVTWVACEGFLTPL